MSAPVDSADSDAELFSENQPSYFKTCNLVHESLGILQLLRSIFQAGSISNTQNNGYAHLRAKRDAIEKRLFRRTLSLQ